MLAAQCRYRCQPLLPTLSMTEQNDIDDSAVDDRFQLHSGKYDNFFGRATKKRQFSGDLHSKTETDETCRLVGCQCIDLRLCILTVSSSVVQRI